MQPVAQRSTARKSGGGVFYREYFSPPPSIRHRKGEALAHPAFAGPVSLNHWRTYDSFFISTPVFFSQLINSARARAYCDREVPSLIPSIFPISTCEKPSTACRLNTV